MIAGQFHQGSGLGNQLHRYVATRVLATDKGCEFGMLHPENFKGKDFMNLDMGKEVSPHHTLRPWHEKEIRTIDGVDIRPYDPEFNFVKDDTIIDGEFQDERYWEHRMGDVWEWLKTEPLEVPDDVCVIGFRGGEYAVFPDLFLPKSYWDKAIFLLSLEHPEMKFEVHTDDPITAKKFFPDYPIVHNIELNWRSVRNAKYAIVANSSFYILPRLLKHYEYRAVQQIDPVSPQTYAPRYWARHNTGIWALPQNYYSRFSYI